VLGVLGFKIVNIKHEEWENQVHCLKHTNLKGGELCDFRETTGGVGYIIDQKII